MHWHIRLQKVGQRWKSRQFPPTRRSAQSAPTAGGGWIAGSFLAASLLFIVGCHRDTKVPSPQATAAEQRPPDKETVEPASRVLLSPLEDGFFGCPMLSSNKLEAFIAEVNECDVRKLNLKPYSGSGVTGKLSISDQLSVLPKILRSCPQLEALALNGWTLRLSDLAVATQCENLQELSVISCIVVDGPVEELNAAPSNLRKLRLTNCLGGRENATNAGEINVGWVETIDEQWAQLLAWTPNLEELSVSGSFRKEGSLTGNDWPLGSLVNLRSVSLQDYLQDSLVDRLLSEVPNLESLSLYGDQLTGEAWLPNKLSAIRHLELYRCEGIAMERLDDIFHSAPQLESFRLSGWHEPFDLNFDLSQANNLRELSITGPREKTQLSLEELPSLRKLESLTLRGLPSNALDGIDLSHLSNLRSLDLSSFGATQKVLTKLPASVESLQLSGFSKSNPDAAKPEANFSHLKALKFFSFSSGSLEDKLFESLPAGIESLSFHHCTVSNSTIATLLSRLDRLVTLSLTWVNGGRGYESDPGVVTGEGWDFACGDRLRTLDLSKCFYLKDELISQIAAQLTGLESLKLAEQRHLTGRNWQLDRLPKLRSLDLRELANLNDRSINQLPVSLESLRIEKCENLTGEPWQLDRLSMLNELRLADCDSLRSLGDRLPESLVTLNVSHCPKLHCSSLDYSSLAQLQHFSMTDCYQFDVKRLFTELPQYASALRTLALTGCESLKDADWDMSPLNETLQILTYDEADPAYVGGLDKALGDQLRAQLPDCEIVL
ncbi:hypothetical protein CKO51_20385 [Rhodopirellula sp. SM50]|nr:hypothetical protein [Rhodopirellula sp. SM50]PAY17588.1 hypothetical protein CKO51_20385 [Rhodopirellula sp. SM50]